MQSKILHEEDWGNKISGFQYKDLMHPDIRYMTGEIFYEVLDNEVGKGTLYRCPDCQSFPNYLEWGDIPRRLKYFSKCELCSDYVCNLECMGFCKNCERRVCRGHLSDRNNRCVNRGACQAFKDKHTTRVSPYKHETCSHCLKSGYKKPLVKCAQCSKRVHSKRCHKIHDCSAPNKQGKYKSVYKPPSHLANTALLCDRCGHFVSYRAALNHQVRHLEPDITQKELQDGMWEGENVFEMPPVQRQLSELERLFAYGSVDGYQRAYCP